MPDTAESEYTMVSNDPEPNPTVTENDPRPQDVPDTRSHIDYYDNMGQAADEIAEVLQGIRDYHDRGTTQNYTRRRV